MPRAVSKLALGTANFGLDYGIVNDFGKISDIELRKILLLAENSRIEVIDTAQAYGDSELRIGATVDSQFQIVTKIGIGLEKNYSENIVAKLVEKSCEQLKRSKIYAVMLHRPELLLCNYGSKIANDLKVLKEKNVVSKIGVSIYSPNILQDIQKLIDLDIVQAPFNIFDQRILSSGWADRLKQANVEIFTRSTFLQGLLLTQKQNLHPYFIENWPEFFNAWFDFLENDQNDAATVALNFALNQPWVNKVVVGVDSAKHLKNLIQVEQFSTSIVFPQLECDDEKLINPSKWRLQ